MEHEIAAIQTHENKVTFRFRDVYVSIPAPQEKVLKDDPESRKWITSHYGNLIASVMSVSETEALPVVSQAA